MLSHRDSEILQHYVAYLGDDYTIYQTGDSSSQTVQLMYVVEFPPIDPEDNWTYVTIGVSRAAMTGSDKQHRIELVLMTNNREASFVEDLGGLAAYPFRFHTWLGVGHTIAGEKGYAILPGSELAEILLIQPRFMPDGFDYIEHTYGTYTRVLWVVPVFIQEREYVVKHGAEALETLFEEYEIDVADPQRVPVVRPDMQA